MAAYNYSISCLLRNPFPFSWVLATAAALGCLLLAISHSQGFGFLTIFLTSSVAILLCPVILYNHKQVVSTSLEPLLFSTAEEHDESPLKLRNQQQDEYEEEEKEVKEEEESNKKAEVLLSDSESVEDHTTSSEDYSENEGSISDEESLIEIVLPRGQYNNNNNNNNNNSNNGVQQKWSDCSLQSHFRHQNWMELMQTELFSDENFIEIDLCMGSIKCPRFEIQA